MNLFDTYLDEILENSFSKGLILVFLSISVAKLIDIIFSYVFKRMVESTENNLDDKILQLLHKPVFYSILFVGLSFAIKTFTLPEYLVFSILGIFKTSIIIIWLFVITKIFVTVVSYLLK